MRKIKFIILICGFFILISCHKKNPTDTPPDDNSHPQVDIPWPSLADSPWPMYHHDPQSTGRSQYRGPRLGKIKWVFEAEGGIYPAVVIGLDSTIYFTSSYELRDNGQKSSLYAVNPDGTLKWRYLFEFPNADDWTPLLTADGTILLATSEGKLYFINPDGTLNKKITPPGGIGVNLNIGMDGVLYFRGNDGYLYAMTQDGEVVWKTIVDSGFWYYGISLSPGGSTIYTFSMISLQEASALCAIDAITGVLKWKYSFDKMNCFATPIVESSEHIIFGTAEVPDKSNIFNLSKDGELIWKYPASVESEPTIDKNGIVYFNDGRSEFFIKSIDLSGNLLWQQAVEAVRGSVICDAEGYVYFFQPDITAIDSDGNIKWQIPLIPNNRIASAAIGHNGVLYVGTFTLEKKLYAIY